MELRKEAEQLAKIYVPVLLISFILKAFSATLLAEVLETAAGGNSPDNLLFLIKLLPILTDAISPIVLGAWLFIRAKSVGYSYAWWGIFGFAGDLFAVAIYFFVRVYEDSTFNKQRQADA